MPWRPRPISNGMDYSKIAGEESIQKTASALKERHMDTFVVSNKEEALEKIKELIPKGASVMNGASMTLESIGYTEYLKSGTHPWNNLHEKVLAEKDPAKQALMRKHSTISDYYVGSVHALAETGEFVVASNTGSQLPSIVFNSPNLIFVVGAQKIVPDLAQSLKRLEEYVYPLEDKRMKDLHGFGSMISKILIFKGENPKFGRKFTVIIIKEKLGF